MLKRVVEGWGPHKTWRTGPRYTARRYKLRTKKSFNSEKKSFQTFQTFQSTLTGFQEMWEDWGVSMDHKDMRVETLLMMVGMEASKKGCFCQTNPTEKCVCV